jgi:mannose-6-phosphate isomerase-like protein (cupin superfamily)
MKRRKFISTTILGSLAGNGLLSEVIAQLPDDKPKAITNKIKRKPLQPLLVKPDNSPTFRSGAKIRFEQTNNQFSCWERVIPPKTMGPSPHVHKDLDEVIRVLKGKVTVMVGEELFEVEEGGWHLRPHGLVHTFWNATNEPALVMEIYPNQNLEVFLEELNQHLSELKKRDIQANSEEAIKRIDELEKEWGIVSYHDQRKPLMEKFGLK